VTSQRYHKMKNHFLAPNLRNMGIADDTWFQQDGANTHKVRSLVGYHSEGSDCTPSHFTMSRCSMASWSSDLTQGGDTSSQLSTKQDQHLRRQTEQGIAPYCSRKYKRHTTKMFYRQCIVMTVI
jgi:hypothetical protein